MTNWIRACSLTVGDTLDLSELRVVFEIEQGSNQSPNMARFRVYNPAPSTVATLQALAPINAGGAPQGTTPIVFAAGYQDNVGPIFSGEVKQVISGHETAVDSYVDIFAADGNTAYNYARVTASLPAGYTPQDKLNAAVQAMGAYGVTMGGNQLSLASPQYPRGAPLVGMARDIIRDVALSAGGLWYILNGQVQLVDPKQQGQGGSLTLDPTTGLIGWPKLTYEGVYTTSLINPALFPGTQIQLDPSTIIGAPFGLNPNDKSQVTQNQFLAGINAGAGLYTVFFMTRRGDTRGQEWYDECLSLGAGGQLPPGASNAGYGQYVVGH